MNMEGGDAGNLMEEATQICGQMKDNPIFSSLLNNMQGSMPNAEQPTQPTQPIQPTTNQVKNINVSDSSHNPNKTRERLQKKLQAKQKNVMVDKTD
jgi:hypothetical protein